MSDVAIEERTTGVREWYKRQRQKHKPLSTTGRVWLFILSLYAACFCVSVFVYWDNLVLKILGVAIAAKGLFAFVASFYNTAARHEEDSHHPISWFALHSFIMLATLFLIRWVAGIVTNYFMGWLIIYGGLFALLVFFRKELIQLLAALIAVLFLFVTTTHWTDIVIGQVTLADSAQMCAQALFRSGPIHDLKNLLITGNYLGYLSRIEYRNNEINIRASNIVSGSNDDELLKTQMILEFVSNQIEYISDPQDGIEYPKDPLVTLGARAGDCEDQTILLCSMLETVGVKSYIVFTREHVFALAQFQKNHRDLKAKPLLYIENLPCYGLDPSRPNTHIGEITANARDVERVFDVRKKAPVNFKLRPISAED